MNSEPVGRAAFALVAEALGVPTSQVLSAMSPCLFVTHFVEPVPESPDGEPIDAADLPPLLGSVMAEDGDGILRVIAQWEVPQLDADEIDNLEEGWDGAV